jgi:uncharacterized tellurite resistance protein B-like protein
MTDPDKERTVLLTAYRMALADGELSANEALLLHLFATGLGVTTAELFALKAEANAVDWDALPALFADRGEQLALFETLCLVALADGRCAPEEQQLAQRLANLLAIDDDEARARRAAAQQRLDELGKSHDLAAEIEANKPPG